MNESARRQRTAARLTAVGLGLALTLGLGPALGSGRGAGRAPAQTPASATQTRPRITGLAHVAFRVTALPASRAFYGDVLGLPQVGGENALHTRFRVSHRQEILLESGLPAGDDERLSHLAFETESLDRLAAHFKAQGVTIETAPPAPASRCAARALWVKDPDGHPLEFVEAASTAARTGRVRGDTPRLGARPVPPLSDRALHAGLTIRDAAAADRFYKTVLGFSEIWRGGRTDSETSWINMKVPDGTDYLEYMLVSGDAPLSRQQRGVLHHVALLVPDIQTSLEAAVRRTPAATRPALASPQVGRNNRWQLNLYDPDGSRVELMEPFTMR